MRKYSSYTRLIVAAALVAFAFVPAQINAQDVATGSATATVLTALAVTATQALQFGNVYQGVPVTVANSDALAGIFTITGDGTAGVSIDLELPDYLSLSDNSDRMVVSFSSTDASVDSTGNVDPAAFGVGWQNVDPYAIPAGTAIGGGGTSALFLGGQVFPAVNQSAGAYSADVVLTVAYNGN
jgi:hypothetical protein